MRLRSMWHVSAIKYWALTVDGERGSSASAAPEYNAATLAAAARMRWLQSFTWSFTAARTIKCVLSVPILRAQRHARRCLVAESLARGELRGLA